MQFRRTDSRGIVNPLHVSSARRRAQPPRRFPWVTYGLIAANVAVYLLVALPLSFVRGRPVRPVAGGVSPRAGGGASAVGLGEPTSSVRSPPTTSSSSTTGSGPWRRRSRRSSPPCSFTPASCTSPATCSFSGSTVTTSSTVSGTTPFLDCLSRHRRGRHDVPHRVRERLGAPGRGGLGSHLRRPRLLLRVVPSQPRAGLGVPVPVHHERHRPAGPSRARGVSHPRQRPPLPGGPGNRGRCRLRRPHRGVRGWARDGRGGADDARSAARPRDYRRRTAAGVVRPPPRLGRPSSCHRADWKRPRRPTSGLRSDQTRRLLRAGGLDGPRRLAGPQPATPRPRSPSTSGISATIPSDRWPPRRTSEPAWSSSTGLRQAAAAYQHLVEVFDHEPGPNTRRIAARQRAWRRSRRCRSSECTDFRWGLRPRSPPPALRGDPTCPAPLRRGVPCTPRLRAHTVRPRGHGARRDPGECPRRGPG